MNLARVDNAIEFVKKEAFGYVDSPYPDEVCTILTILYDYRRELTKQDRRQKVVSQ